MRWNGRRRRRGDSRFFGTGSPPEFCSSYPRPIRCRKLRPRDAMQGSLPWRLSVNSIYTAVSDLCITYKDEASDIFNQRIKRFKNVFSSTEKTLKNYIQFLRKYAAKIKNIENEIRSKSSSLS